ncbi:MAG TPA: FadR family transcriptional regulator [Firmicutes bacterium]|nr:FadR family transcriptional regulator [Bacillota bacterium]
MEQKDHKDKDKAKHLSHIKAAEEIRRRILASEARVGTKLPSEAELVAEIGVGRASIREALKMLSIEGFVEVRQGSGIYVGEPRLAPTIDQLVWYAQIDADAYDHLVELRIILEVGMAPLVVERADQECLQKMADAIWTARQLLAQGQVDLRDCDYEFHCAYLHASGNELAASFGRSLRAYFRREDAGHAVQRTPEAVKKVLMEHAAIYSSILTGDIDNLRRTLVVHLNRRRPVSPLLFQSLIGAAPVQAAQPTLPPEEEENQSL